MSAILGAIQKLVILVIAAMFGLGDGGTPSEPEERARQAAKPDAAIEWVRGERAAGTDCLQAASVDTKA